MSRKTKRKYVFKEVLDEDVSLPTENQTIVRIVGTKGNNLHEVVAPDQSTFLVSMPTKFRKNVWVRRGNYVLIDPIEEGDKVKGEIVRILTSEHIKYLKQDKMWPPEFDDRKKEGDSGGDDDDLPVNTNRLRIDDDCDESLSGSEEDDSEEATDDDLNHS